MYGMAAISAAMSAMSAMSAMTAMTAMHGHVQEVAGQEQQKRQLGQGMDPVLAEKEEQGNSRKREEHPRRTRPSMVAARD